MSLEAFKLYRFRYSLISMQLIGPRVEGGVPDKMSAPGDNLSSEVSLKKEFKSYKNPKLPRKQN
jgi:hypothetical protein